jgi:hypothetical protein
LFRGKRERRRQANAIVLSLVGIGRGRRLSSRGMLLAGAILAVLALWALLALEGAQMVGRTSWDDNCYAPRPVWAIAQALVALVGLGAGLRATVGLVRSGGEAMRWSQLGVAGIALVVWVLVVVVPDQADAVLCPGQPPGSM